MNWIISVTSQTCQEFPHFLTPLFPPATALLFSFSLQQNSSKELYALTISASFPPILSRPHSSQPSLAVPVRVIDDVHVVKVIVQVSVLIQLDPSVALDTANDSLFLETLFPWLPGHHTVLGFLLPKGSLLATPLFFWFLLN